MTGTTNALMHNIATKPIGSSVMHATERVIFNAKNAGEKLIAEILELRSWDPLKSDVDQSRIYCHLSPKLLCGILVGCSDKREAYYSWGSSPLALCNEGVESFANHGVHAPLSSFEVILQCGTGEIRKLIFEDVESPTYITPRTLLGAVADLTADFATDLVTGGSGLLGSGLATIVTGRTSFGW
jgi:hypothetical protein